MDCQPVIATTKSQIKPRNRPDKAKKKLTGEIEMNEKRLAGMEGRIKKPDEERKED